MNDIAERAIDLFVPGRICLFGEHSDWAGANRMFNADIFPGKAIVTGIEQGIYATVKKSKYFIVRSIIPGEEDMSFKCAMDSQELKKTANKGGYFSYVAGVASYIVDWYQVGGLEITITKRTIPIKSGLSSSAAICVLVTRGFNLLYSLNLNTMGEMNIAYLGEQRTPSRCGKLDQACAFGSKPVCMSFNGSEIDVKRLIIKKELNLVFADLKAGKDTIKILSDLNKCFPYPQNDLERKVHEALGPDNDRIVSHAISYLQEGEIEKLGELMVIAQKNFDEKAAPASPVQLSSPKLHSVFEDTTVKKLTFGAKGVGSQGDGSIQFLAKDRKAQSELVQYLANDLKLDAYSLTITPKYTIRKAIIPVAGFGTRLYPATRGVKKEFFPVVDHDGLVKPAILILLEQLMQADIEEICLVIGEEDQEIYENYFMKSLSEEHFNKLPMQLREQEERIKLIGTKLRFVIQKERLGFGHAVYQCREFTENEPVLLLLGDTIYKSNSGNSCSLQMIYAYEQTGQPVVSMHAVPLQDVVHYGIMTGTWENSDQTIMNLTKITEKPTCEYAQDYLGVMLKNNLKVYYSVFGQYVITPEVFDELENNILQNKKSANEYQLTDALEAVREKYGMIGFVPDGEMFDIGNALSYLKTVRAYTDISVLEEQKEKPE